MQIKARKKINWDSVYKYYKISSLYVIILYVQKVIILTMQVHFQYLILYFFKYVELKTEMMHKSEKCEW